MQKNVRKIDLNRDIVFDFLKVIATNLIICHHFQQALEIRWEYPLINFFGGKFYFGYLVELFFIISGICASRWITAIGETITFPLYIYKRAKRLLPLSALSVIVFSILKIIYYLINHVWLYDIAFDLWGGCPHVWAFRQDGQLLILCSIILFGISVFCYYAIL